MRRLTALAVVPLVLVGCDDSAPPPDARETVAVGALPGPLPTAATTVPPTAVSSVPATDEPVTTIETTITDDPQPTRFVAVLDPLVEDDPPALVPTTALRDDTGRLAMDLPDEWSDRRTEPSRLPDGGATPALAAAPDLTSFLDGYDTPGVTAVVVADEPTDALDAYAFDEDCLSGRRGPYLGDDLTGRFEVWESCGGTFNDIVTLAVRPDGADESVLLLVQVVDAGDLVALDAALDSLTLRD